MSKNEDKLKEPASKKVLEAICMWRLIYDKERDIYIKVACVSNVDVVDDNDHNNGSS